MKKTVLLSVLLILTVIFSACNNKKNIDVSNLHSEATDNINTTQFHSQALNETSEHSHTNTTQIPELTTSTTTKETEKISESNEKNNSPILLSLTLNDLIKVKNLLDTYSPQEFNEYMEKNETTLAMNGFWSYENTIKLLKELEATCIPLLDGEKENFSQIMFYWERNEVQQITFFDEESRVVCYIYTPESGRDSEGRFGENENAVFIKSIENNLAKAEVYKIGDKEYFCVDVLVEDTYIFMRTHKIISVEEFETNFNRLEFVKIGDLIA